VAGLNLTVVSPERELYAGEVDMVLAPAVGGQVGILPNHATMMTQLTSGELCVRVCSEEYFFAIHGGFMHVLPDRVIVLADAAERADEIDEERALAARQRAMEMLNKTPPEERRLTEVALRRSQVRLRVAKRRRRRRATPYPDGGSRE